MKFSIKPSDSKSARSSHKITIFATAMQEYELDKWLANLDSPIVTTKYPLTTIAGRTIDLVTTGPVATAFMLKWSQGH